MSFVQHGKQCICQICTCGRHRCPHDRNISRIELGDGSMVINPGDHYKRKEFATAGSSGYELIRPVERRGETTLFFSATNRPQSSEAARNKNVTTETLSDAFLTRPHRSEHQLVTATALDIKQRFDMSAKLRERSQTSQIAFPTDNQQTPIAMSTSYREQSECIAKSKQARALSSRPAREQISEIFNASNGTDQSNLSTVNRTEYGVKQVKGTESKRPPTSEHWKTTGSMNDATVTRSDYAPKRVEPTMPVRPKNSTDVLHVEDNAPFTRETSNLSDYAPKQVKRLHGVRPNDHKDAFRRDNTFDSTSVNRVEFAPKSAERVKPVRHREAGVFDMSTRKEEFVRETSKMSDYPPPTVMERTRSVPPNDHIDVFKPGGTMNTNSINHTDYSHTKGERYEMRRPRDSDMLQHDGTIAKESTTRSEFTAKKSGECYTAKRPETSDLWKNNGRIDSNTISRSEYSPNKRGERHAIRRPVDSEIFERDSNNVPPTTITREEYTRKKVTSTLPLHVPHSTFTLGTETNRAIDYETVTHRDFSREVSATDFPDICCLSQHDPGKSTMSTILHMENTLPPRSLTHDEFVWRGSECNISYSAHRRKSQLSLADVNSVFDDTTVYKENYHNTTSQRPLLTAKVSRPPSALKMSGEHQMTSGYKEEFNRQRLEDGANVCVAGELMESVRQNHPKTRHFEFRQVDNGHYFYHPRRTPPSKQTTSTS